MEEKRQTQQEREKVRKRRRIRNQVIVYIGVFAFAAAVAAATVPGVKRLLQGGQPQQNQQVSQIQQENQESSQASSESREAEAASIPTSQQTENMERILAEMRPALVSLKGSGDGVNYTTGSGFIVDIQEEVLFICTCRHVIESLDNWDVGFYDGTTVKGIKTGVSQVYDVGIVEVSLEQLPDQLSQNLFALSVDADHWNALYGRKTNAGFVSMYREEGSDSYMTGQLLDVLADYPWGDLCQSEFQIAFVYGDSGSAIFDEEGMLISMALGTSYDGETEDPRRWGVPLSAIMTCYMEIINQRNGA